MERDGSADGEWAVPSGWMSTSSGPRMARAEVSEFAGHQLRRVSEGGVPRVPDELCTEGTRSLEWAHLLRRGIVASAALLALLISLAGCGTARLPPLVVRPLSAPVVLAPSREARRVRASALRRARRLGDRLVEELTRHGGDKPKVKCPPPKPNVTGFRLAVQCVVRREGGRSAFSSELGSAPDAGRSAFQWATGSIDLTLDQVPQNPDPSWAAASLLNFRTDLLLFEPNSPNPQGQLCSQMKALAGFDPLDEVQRNKLKACREDLERFLGLGLDQIDEFSALFTPQGLEELETLSPLFRAARVAAGAHVALGEARLSTLPRFVVPLDASGGYFPLSDEWKAADRLQLGGIGNFSEACKDSDVRRDLGSTCSAVAGGAKPIDIWRALVHELLEVPFRRVDAILHSSRTSTPPSRFVFWGESLGEPPGGTIGQDPLQRTVRIVAAVRTIPDLTDEEIEKWVGPGGPRSGVVERIASLSEAVNGLYFARDQRGASDEGAYRAWQAVREVVLELLQDLGANRVDVAQVRRLVAEYDGAVLDGNIQRLTLLLDRPARAAVEELVGVGGAP